jgi:hypothetical protein
VNVVFFVASVYGAFRRFAQNGVRLLSFFVGVVYF